MIVGLWSLFLWVTLSDQIRAHCHAYYSLLSKLLDCYFVKQKDSFSPSSAVENLLC